MGTNILAGEWQAGCSRECSAPGTAHMEMYSRAGPQKPTKLVLASSRCSYTAVKMILCNYPLEAEPNNLQSSELMGPVFLPS